MNPYVDDSNPYYVSYGNSKLKSERSHGFSLSYGYVAPKFNMNISVYASFVNNSIESARTLQEYNGIEGVIVSTYENVGKYSNVGGNFYIDYNPFKWVRFSAQGRSGYAHYKNNDYSYGTYSWNVFSSLNFTLPWKVKLNIGGGGSSPWVGYKYRGTSWYYYYGSLMRSFLKGDKLTVSLDARDLFEKYRSYTSKSWEENIFSRESISKQPSRTFGISVSWRFGEMEAEIKKAERGISNSDVKSGGGSSGGGN